MKSAVDKVAEMEVIFWEACCILPSEPLREILPHWMKKQLSSKCFGSG